MKKYLKEIEQIIKEHVDTADALVVFNKEGIVEYVKPYRGNVSDSSSVLHKDLVGKHVLEIYGSSISEEESTVLRTLKTGKISTVEHQILDTDDRRIVNNTITYPVFDDEGNVAAAVDVAHVIEYLDRSQGDDAYTSSVLESIITENKKLKALKSRLADMATSDSATFIYGETGTGKELIARAIHDLSNRRTGPFVSQNCAAIPENLMESIFFGTEKGGFTGAEMKRGLFEMADGGTLFLDEVNSMSLGVQSKLLKALEEQKVRKIGGEKDVSFDVRIVCASNEEPETLIQEKRMRADFYYRISMIRVTIPPLRERKEDILPLTKHFIRHFNQKTGKNIGGVSTLAEDILLDWDWPGNVRELKGTIERAFAIEDNQLITMNALMELVEKNGGEKGALPAEAKHEEAAEKQREEPAGELADPFAWADGRLEAGERIDMNRLLEECERTLILKAIAKYGRFNVAAEKLSMSPQKLNYRMAKLEIKKFL